MGSTDLLIAVRALCPDLALVTANATEFSSVLALKVEDWLAPREGLRAGWLTFKDYQTETNPALKLAGTVATYSEGPRSWSIARCTSL